MGAALHVCPSSDHCSGLRVEDMFTFRHRAAHLHMLNLKRTVKRLFYGHEGWMQKAGESPGATETSTPSHRGDCVTADTCPSSHTAELGRVHAAPEDSGMPLTLRTTAFSSSAQAWSRVRRTGSRCCVMWPSACSSSTASSCADFTLVATTQSVMS